MAEKVNLDAMIPRADFASTRDDQSSAEKIQTFSIEQLKQDSLLVHRLRKPDFQRETNHWDAKQVLVFLKSFLDNELVPSAILWQSPSHVFVIDGGHRISTLRAWVEDDYGDGPLSLKFYLGTIPEDQKRVAKRVRNLINKEIGTYATLRAAMIDPESYSDEVLKTRARNLATRSLSLQWVEGDAEKAETSFFKINTQGTPLHKTEERLLRERRNPVAISARSIVRAGAGHKYWSRFEDATKDEIEASALKLHELLFQPEINEPIKTLDLPLGGRSSPIGALNLLMDFIATAAREPEVEVKDWAINQPDPDGRETVNALKQCYKVMSRITGNSPSSLGLHPAIYFYNHRGKHSDHLFLAVTRVFARAVQDNNKQFFRDFTNSREELERYLKSNKTLINQAISQIYSSQRVNKLSDMITGLITGILKGETIDTSKLLLLLGLQGKLVASELEGESQKFTDETKSAIYLRQSLEKAFTCPICGGLVDANKSASYDHIKRKSEGGSGSAENGQITHPYCNTGIKN
ncbi:HNH endonuclease [Sulfitobacter geojensis]|uniref:HNH endonuclease n=1 Tax=Sulfitobacter geojensis TaxID=1342299 RepID=UPI002492BF39|nr:HNH endonuclease signature motif containing protein [Sulfitobacter geojensis]